MSTIPFDAQNAGYVQELYEQYARNPDTVPEAWRHFFALGPEETARAGLLVPEGLSSNGGQTGTDAPAATATVRTEPQVERRTEGDGRMARLVPAGCIAASIVQAYRDHGHMLAKVDPLGSAPPGHPQLDPTFFGTSMEELDQIPASVVMREGVRPGETVAAALRRLGNTYSGYIGYEFEHLEDPERVRWLWDPRSRS